MLTNNLSTFTWLAMFELIKFAQDVIGHCWLKKSGIVQEVCFDAKATISAMNL